MTDQRNDHDDVLSSEVAGHAPEASGAPSDDRASASTSSPDTISEASSDPSGSGTQQGSRQTEVEDTARDEEFFDLSEGKILDYSTQSFRIALLGGKNVGKSYLFRAMLFRLSSDPGAFSEFLARERIELYAKRYSASEIAGVTDTQFRPMSVSEVNDSYRNWDRLLSTTKDVQWWYRVHIPCATGWLRKDVVKLEMGFFDGSGEYFRSGPKNRRDAELWSEAFLRPSVLILCLPMWAAFPDEERLLHADKMERKQFLEDFDRIVESYQLLRTANTVRSRTQVILALTQADSILGNRTVREHWIAPCVREPGRHLSRLRRGRGLAQYLASARAVSQYLTDECAGGDDPALRGLLGTLEFGGGGRPWLLPVSAVDGDLLARIERRTLTEPERVRLKDPVPAHVELPLLVSLAERFNALV